jgi:hypothetical protein
MLMPSQKPNVDVARSPRHFAPIRNGAPS